MKTKILALVAILTISGFIFTDSITVNVDPALVPGIQAAADAYNAQAKTEFDAARKAEFVATQAALPVDQRVTLEVAKLAQYPALTWQVYYAWRCEQVGESYAEADVKARILKEQPLIEGLARKPPAERDAIIAELKAKLK